MLAVKRWEREWVAEGKGEGEKVTFLSSGCA